MARTIELAAAFALNAATIIAIIPTVAAKDFEPAESKSAAGHKTLEIDANTFSDIQTVQNAPTSTSKPTLISAPGIASASLPSHPRIRYPHIRGIYAAAATVEMSNRVPVLMWTGE